MASSNNEAIAYERASDFYRARGFGEIADLYLRNARYGYLRWGADGKVRRLEAMYPQLTTGEPAPGPTSTIATPVERLDLATVIKVSQTVSGEIVLEKLVETLMRTAIAQAGAERGLLILSRGAEPRIEAEATTGGDAVRVKLSDLPVNATVLPETVLHYVLRTRESIILDDAASNPSFAADPYIRQRQARSILCLPLINQGKLIGVIYLENNLTPGAFAPARIAVLKLLASQAAVSLENTRLYRDLEQREAKIRRLVDANIIGIYVWDSEGRILEGNDAFLRIVGYDRNDLVAGRLHRDGLTPPEWRDRTARGVTELRTTGTIQPFEKEYIRKDGSRVPVLLGAAGFDETANEGVTFVVDLTERKQAEAEARESERRYRELQGEFAHANRVATMGQLTASIAHEVNQPIAAAVTNANAGLRWLSAGRPDLEEARQAFRSRPGERQSSGRGHRPYPRAGQESASAEGRRGDQRGDPRGRRADPWRSGEERRLGQDAARGGLADHRRRPGATATSDPQPDRQRHRGDERNEQRNAATIAAHERESRAGRRHGRGQGFGSGSGAGDSRPPLRRLLYDQG